MEKRFINRKSSEYEDYYIIMFYHTLLADWKITFSFLSKYFKGFSF